MRLRLTAMLAIAAFVVLAGCTGTPGSSVASAAPSTAATSSAPSVPPSPPPVENPLDIAAFDQRPCELLTPEQLAELGFTEPGVEFPAFGPPFDGCDWYADSSNKTLTVEPVPERDLLAEVYERGDWGYEVFRPTTVAGHPAIIREEIEGNGRCEFTIATGPGTGLRVTSSEIRTPEGDYCGRGLAAAEAAMGNLVPAPG